MKDASENAATSRTRKKDRRSLYTEGAIKDALLREIACVSYAGANISSVCRRAEITRPTFYLHYDNLSEVLEELIEDVAQEIGDVPMDLCNECGSAALADLLRSESSDDEHKKPFCQMVLGDGKYAPLFMDDYIAGRVVERIVDSFAQASMKAGLSEENARKLRTINLFRMNGCMAAARSFRRSGDDWGEAMPMIDGFVASGLMAVFEKEQE